MERLSRLSKVDTVIIPSWRNPEERASEDLLRALRAAHARGEKIVGLCLGAFVLAQAGLLDGRRAAAFGYHGYLDRRDRRIGRIRKRAFIAPAFRGKPADFAFRLSA